jgi:DNA-binding NarL/FixJ family response regulator
MIWPTLTPYEQRLVKCLLKGHGNKEIARELNVSVRKIKVCLTNIFKKTGINYAPNGPFIPRVRLVWLLHLEGEIWNAIEH